jgi:hypothetical protein
MSEKTHWLQSPNKNYLGHWDIPESGEMVVTIDSAQWEAVTNPIINKTESKRVIRFKENIKPMICNQINAQSILKATGVKFMEDSKGQSICLFVGVYRDKVSKEEIDCIRVKSKGSVGFEEVKAMFDKKKNLIAPIELDAVQKVVDQKQAEKYQRVYNYLSKL